MAFKFSVIICTHNPVHVIFARCLNAISLLKYDIENFEVIVVDNNSEPSLNEISFVQDYLHIAGNAVLINEKKPGLTSARLAGIRHAKNEWIVFFDDDNEPAPDYLQAATTMIEQYPNVGAWGPGTVEVIYTNSPSPQWLQKSKNVFQQRNNAHIEFDTKQSWQDCYPFGTGLVINRMVCNEYCHRVNNKIYSLSDRNGKSLSSGGDVQLVLTGINMNYAAGVSPAMRINHLIDQRKANFKYILKVTFGTAASNYPAHYQVWPDHYKTVSAPQTKQIIKQVYYYTKEIAFKEGVRIALIKLSHFIGESEGIYMIGIKRKKNFLHTILMRLLNVE